MMIIDLLDPDVRHPLFTAIYTTVETIDVLLGLERVSISCDSWELSSKTLRPA